MRLDFQASLAQINETVAKQDKENKKVVQNQKQIGEKIAKKELSNDERTSEIVEILNENEIQNDDSTTKDSQESSLSESEDTSAKPIKEKEVIHEGYLGKKINIER